jgi:predicted XRE-type DNA-binding protein
MENHMPMKVTIGSDNIFLDLGFPPAEAEHLKVRADLSITLVAIIRANKLTQARAAKLFGVSQPRVSDLVRGKVERFSIDTLVEMLGQAGCRVDITVRGPAERQKMVVLRSVAELRKFERRELERRGTRHSGLAAGRENGARAPRRLSSSAASPESRVPRAKKR